MAHFKEQIRHLVKHRTSLTLEQLIDRVNPIIRGWRNYFASGGYPRAVFFQLDGFVCARFYRWSRRLSQRAGKRLAQNAWEILRKAGLQFLQPIVGARLSRVHDEVLQQNRMRENLMYGIDGGLLDKLGEAWSLPYYKKNNNIFFGTDPADQHL